MLMYGINKKVRNREAIRGPADLICDDLFNKIHMGVDYATLWDLRFVIYRRPAQPGP